MTFDEVEFVAGRREQPPGPTISRLDTVQTRVDKNLCEPEFEEKLFAKRWKMGERLEEGVLNYLIDLGGLTKIVKRDPGSSMLMTNDELLEALAGALVLSLREQALDRTREF
jgi:hypothetical protein